MITSGMSLGKRLTLSFTSIIAFMAQINDISRSILGILIMTNPTQIKPELDNISKVTQANDEAVADPQLVFNVNTGNHLLANVNIELLTESIVHMGVVAHKSASLP